MGKFLYIQQFPILVAAQTTLLLSRPAVMKHHIDFSGKHSASL